MLQRLKTTLPPGVVAGLRRGRRAGAAVRAWVRHDYRMAWPPGHYYSPIPAHSDVVGRLASPGPVRPELPGIDLGADRQLDLVRELARHYDDQPFPDHRVEGSRYYFENDFFSYGDALVLHGMLRHLKPAQVIEVGSGFSSAAMLDTADRFLGNATTFMFIEPFAERLDELLRGSSVDAEIVRQPVQDVDVKTFARLQRGDILFIDSTHVSKAGSDVNHLFFEVLPSLSPGVIVHVHDIHYPFDYPVEWLADGRAWNEAYLLRTFLAFNEQFRIILWNSYLSAFHAEAVGDVMPLWSRNPGGSLWLQRT